MALDDQALPLTRGQLDIWLAQQTGFAGTEWQLGLMVKIEGVVDRDILERALRQVVREVEPARATIYESDGHVVQRAIDDPEIEFSFHDLSNSRHPVREARAIAASIQRTPMKFAGPLFKAALFETWTDEFYMFAVGHHIIIDGTGMTLVAHRIATVYAAMVSGAAVPPVFFGSLRDLVRIESEYEATADYLDRVVSLTTVLGAAYLTLLSLIPEVFVAFGDMLPYKMGGGSALIVVCTILDIRTQVRGLTLTNPGGVRQ